MTGAKPPSKQRRSAFRRGHLAEYRAALALLLKGYRILAIRYKTKMGEIDIVARKGDLIACVEVKARGSQEAAISAVSAPSQSRIRAASDIWLSNQPLAARYSIRYDIVSVTPWGWPRHFPDAF
ncbi:YraN family protein [Pararhizobium sp.]|uniref:YraN family protein n=1 Tax=Pararhizobium sp. TaxID=1977563 RepID=UPI002719D37F|nr:YraN family protein [Pararhizobium sp.]MDO9417676.1 YraN family protein [Pararhizobium sp.]